MTGSPNTTADALVRAYQLELDSPPCHPGAATWSARAAKVLVWKNAGRSFANKSPPNLMVLYRLLPRTNCGRCGCGTCMAFAAALLGAP